MTYPLVTKRSHLRGPGCSRGTALSAGAGTALPFPDPVGVVLTTPSIQTNFVVFTCSDMIMRVEITVDQPEELGPVLIRVAAEHKAGRGPKTGR